MDARLIIALALATGCSAGGGDEMEPTQEEIAEAHDEAVCGTIKPRNDSEVLLCNELGEGIIANVAMPSGTPPARGWPGVVVLHGSGGLHASGPSDKDPCSEMLEVQFQKWAELLTARGYAVLMPDSWYSRGFCEWNDSTRPADMTQHERLILRTFDAAAAANWLCDDPRVDCSRLALLGFSNGASVTLMMLYEDLDKTADPRLHDLDDVPAFVGGVAYYPGCGLENELFDDLDSTQIDRYYYPTAPLWVPHAEKDPLHDDCVQVRDPQVDIVSQHRGVSQDVFEIEIYPKAKHGFDGATTDDRKADHEASVAAEAVTLSRFEDWFF